MAASFESVAGSSKIRFSYAVKTNFVKKETVISTVDPGTPSSSSSSSASVVFKVQDILRLSVAGGNPLNEFLEEKNWQAIRESSSLELPWSRDGLIIDDDNHLKVSETLTLLRVPKVSHQSIIDGLCLQTVAVFHLVGLAPEIVVHIFEVTHITLPLIDEEGKSIKQENRDYYEGESTIVDCLQTEEEEIDQAKFIDSLKKFIVVAAGDINEEDESAYIVNWYCDLIDAIKRVAWPVTKEAKEEEKEGKVEEEEKEAKVVDEERNCPICMEILEPDKAWSKMPCCSQVFHCDCISKWTKLLKKCPWCRSSLLLVLQSAKGLIRRLYSKDLYIPKCPGFHDLLVVIWHLLAQRVWWTVPHDRDCKCGCPTRNIRVTLA